MYNIAKTCTCTQDTFDASQRRWQRILQSNDARILWKAVGWDGSVSWNQNLDKPSDECFKSHFESLLNPTKVELMSFSYVNSKVYIPVLDDPIQPDELLLVVN